MSFLCLLAKHERAHEIIKTTEQARKKKKTTARSDKTEQKLNGIAQKKHRKKICETELHKWMIQTVFYHHKNILFQFKRPWWRPTAWISTHKMKLWTFISEEILWFAFFFRGCFPLVNEIPLNIHLKAAQITIQLVILKVVFTLWNGYLTPQSYKISSNICHQTCWHLQKTNFFRLFWMTLRKLMANKIQSRGRHFFNWKSANIITLNSIWLQCMLVCRVWYFVCKMKIFDFLR